MNTPCIPYKTSRRQLLAFTLVELLVSIVIIAIIIALLAPAASSALSGTRDIRCVQNLKFWGSAMQRYSADNNQLVVTAVPGLTMWATALNSPYLEYLDDKASLSDGTSLEDARRLIFQIRQCPGNTKRAAGDDSPDYACPWFTPPGNDPPYDPPLYLPGLSRPANFLLMCDAVPAWLLIGPSEINTKIRPVCDGSGGVQIRHRGKANVLFADFHVSPESWSAIQSNGFFTR